MMTDQRQHSPAAERNRQPILDVLLRVLPPRGHALEIASGTGQHVVHFAAAMPGWNWQPTDFDAHALASIDAWRADAGIANVQPAKRLDVMDARWLDGRAWDAIYCSNMLHIAPWPTCRALMDGAARHLAAPGVLVTYGPYLAEGQPVAAGNAAFDADLRARNPQWGIRQLGEVVRAAESAGLTLIERTAMPANNLTLVFARRSINR